MKFCWIVFENWCKLPSPNSFIILTEAERKKFLDQFLYAEQELAAAKGREQALQEQLLKEMNDFQERFKKQIQSQSEVEVCLFAFHNLILFAESMNPFSSMSFSVVN